MGPSLPSVDDGRQHDFRARAPISAGPPVRIRAARHPAPGTRHPAPGKRDGASGGAVTQSHSPGETRPGMRYASWS
ncbi:hypothetical protein TPA0908_43680 [Micromonospora sp. AKA38]|nr:hypothetical protein TPA0908_43680 [Micromonospora sp. AKA38]